MGCGAEKRGWQAVLHSGDVRILERKQPLSSGGVRRALVIQSQKAVGSRFILCGLIFDRRLRRLGGSGVGFE